MQGGRERLYPTLPVGGDETNDDSAETFSSLSSDAEEDARDGVSNGRSSSSSRCAVRRQRRVRTASGSSFSGEEGFRRVALNEAESHGAGGDSGVAAGTSAAPKAPVQSNWLFSWLVCLLVVVVVVGVVNVLLLLWRGETSTDGDQRRQPVPFAVYRYDERHVADGFRELRRRFPAQADRTWPRLKVAVKSMLRDYPQNRRPSVALAIYGGSARRTAYCLAASVAEMVSDVVDGRRPPVTVNCSQHEYHSSSDSAKLLDDRLKAALTNSAAVILENIADLTGDAIRMLHAFCDTEHAPFKQRLIVMTCLCAQTTADADAEADVALEADQCLEALCTSKLIAEDSALALISRISSNAVRVLPEAAPPC